MKTTINGKSVKFTAKLEYDSGKSEAWDWYPGCKIKQYEYSPGFWVTIRTKNEDDCSFIFDTINEAFIEELKYCEHEGFVRCPSCDEEVDEQHEFADWISTKGWRDVDTKDEYREIFKDVLVKLKGGE